MKENEAQIFTVIAAAILGVSLIIAGASVSNGLENFRNYDRSVMMKGLAQEDVKADLALWTLSYTETGNDLAQLQELMDSRGEMIKNYLISNGIKETEITLNNVNVQDLMAQSYRQNNNIVNRYIMSQSYLVRTNNVEVVDQATKNIGDLIKQGVVFTANSSRPVYLFTKLNDIKPDMIAQATENAREAAEEFADNSDSDVGGIKRASQGVFQILARDQTYALPEAQQIHKTVRVVSTIEFYLED
ncbi:MAG: SIMPL domain-containing protein [Pseudomonadota bacterium]